MNIRTWLVLLTGSILITLSIPSLSAPKLSTVCELLLDQELSNEEVQRYRYLKAQMFNSPIYESKLQKQSENINIMWQELGEELFTLHHIRQLDWTRESVGLNLESEKKLQRQLEETVKLAETWIKENERYRRKLINLFERGLKKLDDISEPLRAKYILRLTLETLDYHIGITIYKLTAISMEKQAAAIDNIIYQQKRIRNSRENKDNSSDENPFANNEAAAADIKKDAKKQWQLMDQMIRVLARDIVNLVNREKPIKTSKKLIKWAFAFF